jgi:hypothetical protein
MFDTCSQTGATIVRRAKGRDRVADWIPLGDAFVQYRLLVGSDVADFLLHCSG